MTLQGEKADSPQVFIALLSILPPVSISQRGWLPMEVTRNEYVLIRSTDHPPPSIESIH